MRKIKEEKLTHFAEMVQGFVEESLTKDPDSG